MFSCFQRNLEIFNHGCKLLAERLTIYIETGDIRLVPMEPPVFGNLTHILEDNSN